MQKLTDHRSIGAKSTDPTITRKVTLDYSLTAASAFSQLAKEQGKKFRFVFTSGILAVREGKSILIPYAAEARRVAVSPLSPLLTVSTY
jgi:hypothetical protein